MTTLALPDRFSMSFIQDASRCLRMAHLKREVDTAGEDATVGSVVHDIAALAGLQARRLGVESIPADNLEHLARTVLRNPGEGVKPLSLDGWRKVIDLSRRLSHSYDEGPPAFPLGARYEVYAIRERDGRKVSARIDWMWLDGSFCWLKDYKSGGKNAGWEPTFQGEVYAWQLLGTYPDLDGFWLAEHPIPYGGPKWAWIDAGDLTGPGSIEEYLACMIGEIEAAYAAPPLTPTPGPWCRTMCPDRAGCPLPEIVKGEAVDGEAGAVALLDRLLVSRARTSEVADTLKDWLTANDRTHIVSSSGEQEFGWTDGTRCAVRKSRSEDA